MTTPPPTTLGREQIARIIHPNAWSDGAPFRSPLMEEIDARNREISLAKADAILSALSAQHEADRARIGELEARLRQVLPLLKVCYFASARAEFLAALLNPEQSR